MIHSGHARRATSHPCIDRRSIGDLGWASGPNRSHLPLGPCAAQLRTPSRAWRSQKLWEPTLRLRAGPHPRDMSCGTTRTTLTRAGPRAQPRTDARRRRRKAPRDAPQATPATAVPAIAAAACHEPALQSGLRGVAGVAGEERGQVGGVRWRPSLRLGLRRIVWCIAQCRKAPHGWTHRTGCISSWPTKTACGLRGAATGLWPVCTQRLR